MARETVYIPQPRTVFITVLLNITVAVLTLHLPPRLPVVVFCRSHSYTN